MKKIFLLLLLVPFYCQAQTLSFTFANPRIVNGGNNFEFEIKMHCNQSGTFHSLGLVYFDYNTAAFGNAIAGNITLTPLNLLNENVFGVLPKYNLSGAVNNTASRIAIPWQSLFLSQAPSSSFHTAVPTTPTDLVRVNIPILNNTQTAGINFNENLMNGEQFYIVGPNQNMAYGNPNVYSNNGFISQALPIKLLMFSAEENVLDVNLSWSSNVEQNFSHYDIERSIDQRNWQNIGKVDGNGDTYTSANYQWTDAGALRNATGEYLYYRLKMVDTDASSEYSPIRSVRVLKSVKTVHVQPNPATNALYIAYDSDEAAAITVSLYDNTGKLALLTTYKSGMPVDVSALPRGVYSLQLTDRSTVLATERVVLQ